MRTIWNDTCAMNVMNEMPVKIFKYRPVPPFMVRSVGVGIHGIRNSMIRYMADKPHGRKITPEIDTCVDYVLNRNYHIEMFIIRQDIQQFRSDYVIYVGTSDGNITNFTIKYLKYLIYLLVFAYLKNYSWNLLCLKYIIDICSIRNIHC